MIVGPSIFVVVTRTSEEKVMSTTVLVASWVLKNFVSMWEVWQGRGQSDDRVPSIK